MRRLLTISLTLVYLTFSAGLAIGNHFCGGKLAEITVFKAPKTCCLDANSEKSCCQNTTSTLKITNEHDCNFTSSDVPQAKLVMFAEMVFAIAPIDASGNTIKQWFADHNIKPSEKSPIYLTNRVFII